MNIRILGKAAALAVIVVPVVLGLTGCGGSGSNSPGYSAKSMDDYTCEYLADEAIDISADKDVQILHITGLRTMADFRAGWSNPSHGKPNLGMSIPFRCSGQAVLSTGMSSGIELSLKQDSEDNLYVTYRG